MNPSTIVLVNKGVMWANDVGTVLWLLAGAVNVLWALGIDTLLFHEGSAIITDHCILLQLSCELVHQSRPLSDLSVSRFLKLGNSVILCLLFFLVELPDDLVLKVEKLLVDLEFLEFFTSGLKLTW